MMMMLHIQLTNMLFAGDAPLNGSKSGSPLVQVVWFLWWNQTENEAANRWLLWCWWSCQLWYGIVHCFTWQLALFVFHPDRRLLRGPGLNNCLWSSSNMLGPWKPDWMVIFYRWSILRWTRTPVCVLYFVFVILRSKHSQRSMPMFLEFPMMFYLFGKSTAPIAWNHILSVDSFYSNNILWSSFTVLLRL